MGRIQRSREAGPRLAIAMIQANGQHQTVEAAYRGHGAIGSGWGHWVQSLDVFERQELHRCRQFVHLKRLGGGSCRQACHSKSLLGGIGSADGQRNRPRTTDRNGLHPSSRQSRQAPFHPLHRVNRQRRELPHR